jgi:hypothetical protein
MALTLKRKLDSFKQWTLLFSSRGELTTQALENIQTGQSAVMVRLGASMSAEQGASLFVTTGATCNSVTSSADEINIDTAMEGCPEVAAPLYKKSRKR